MSAPVPVTAALVAFLAWASASDLRTRTIPNACSLGGAALTLAVAVGCGTAPVPRLAAGCALALPLAAACALRPAGLGAGDAKLALLVGAGLGAPGAAALLVAFVTALGWAGGAALLRPSVSLRGTVVPLAPFMAFGSSAVAGLVA